MHVYSASDFAERLNVSSIWVRELARKGRIYPAHKVGKNWVFFDSSTVIRPFERGTGAAEDDPTLRGTVHETDDARDEVQP
jgi:hypothetical protein